MTTASEVQMIPVDAIAVLNPRARNKRVFHELITSIAHLGLKKPITVSRRGTEPGYDLVCGQGRLEAFGIAGSRRRQQSSTFRLVRPGRIVISPWCGMHSDALGGIRARKALRLGRG